ncbi:glycosyltransferase [Lewinella cohaerens]|jgi:glycosyltransferase involved in cell wall biosynthesis|uniref:glycosyltransferase n=1 Tax=Lewinella cohaerens TaxID=70995 RepID=UPI000364A2B6|nr:glycosyltransferase [Lewinella cohaerens]
MKILQINTTINTGSTGRIAEGIGAVLLDSGHESYIAYGRNGNPSQSKEIKIGNALDNYLHGAKTLLFDRHGFGSTRATQALVQQLEEIQPDAIGLHNLHGYYLNIEVLFNYLKEREIPIVWTLFDCWAFTGHCTYYDSIACNKWLTECHACPKIDKYPRSLGVDQSSRNFRDKKRLFQLPQNLHLVVHSQWLLNQVKQSFLQELPVHHIYNGTDLKVFQPQQNKTDQLVLGVASTWDERKGLADFIRLRKVLSEDYSIVLIGLSPAQIEQLPPGITGIARTESVEELAKWYSKALCFVNPTYQDNFPTTNIEALACGTPVVTYDTGGSPEAADDETGKVVQKGDIAGLKEAILSIKNKNKEALSKACRLRAEVCFDQKERYREYIDLYEKLVF